MTQKTLNLIDGFLRSRLDTKAAAFVRTTHVEIQNAVTDARFTALVSLSSRHIPRQLLSPSPAEAAQASALLPGLDLQSWTLLETVRISLILSHPDVLAADFAERFNHWFAYADEGELCAYYRSIAVLPEPQRFVWRAAEGCRTNMKNVFMAVTCDSPYPQQYFDDVAWNQLVVKALFTETPLARVYALDRRLSPTLASIVLDYMEERSSAGRDIPLDAWLCLGQCTEPRFDQAVKHALESPSPQQGRAAVVALGRGHRVAALEQLRKGTNDPHLKTLVQQVLDGRFTQHDFHEFVSH